MIFTGLVKEQTLDYNFYPEDMDNFDLIFIKIPEKDNGSIEGNHLSFLYLALIDHLSKSYLEPPNFGGYLRTILHNNPMKIEFVKSKFSKN